MSLSTSAQQLTIQYVKRIPIKGMPEYEFIVLNDDLQNIIRHKPTNTYHCASILHAVAKDGPVQKLAYWFRLSETLELLKELDTNGENSPPCSKTLEELKQSLFRYVSNKDMPDKYKYLRGYYCPQILVHELGGWANKRYRIKLLKYLENHYTDDYVQELEHTKESLEEKLERMHRESMAKMDEQSAELRSLREENIEQHKKTRAVVKRVQKRATNVDNSINDITDAVTSKNTDGLLLISTKHAGSLRGGKPTTILKCNAIENKSITKGAYTNRINNALIKISCRHPKDAFRVLAKFLDDLHLLIPFPNGKKYDGNLKEFRVFDDTLERIKRAVKDNLPDQLNGAIINIRSEIESINEAVKDIAN